MPVETIAPLITATVASIEPLATAVVSAAESVDARMNWWDWILFAISSVAFLMSAATWIRTAVFERRRIVVSPVAKRFYDPNGDSPIRLLYVVIGNLSNLPISITAIAIVSENSEGREKIYTSTYPEQPFFKRKTTQRGEVLSTEERNALEIPVNIMGRCSSGGVLLFSIDPQVLKTDATHLTLQVSTTRGKVRQRIPLSDLPDLDTMWLWK